MSEVPFESSLVSLRPRAAGESTSCSCWMAYAPMGVKSMDINERISLRAMVSYVAHTTGRAEFRIERDLSDKFCVPNMNYLPAEKYEQAVSFLSRQVVFQTV